MNEDPQLSTSASRPGCSKKRGGGNLSLDAVPSAPGWEEKFVIHILADRSWPGDSGDRDWLTQIVQRWQRKREIQWLVVAAIHWAEARGLMSAVCWCWWNVETTGTSVNHIMNQVVLRQELIDAGPHVGSQGWILETFPELLWLGLTSAFLGISGV